MSVVISKRLLSATCEALAILNRHYPRKFAMAFGNTEDADLFQTEWAQAFLQCDLDKIPEAARQWVANEKYPPSAAEVGQIARELTFKDRPAPVLSPVEQPQPSLSKNGELTDALYFAAKDRMLERGYEGKKFARPISQMWGLLAEAQPSDEQAGAVRDGEIDLHVWYATVDAWLAGARPRGHPMNNIGASMASAMLGRGG